MRQKRAKSYRKQMLVYNHTFKFREPYQVIVDDSLVLICQKQAFDLTKGLSRTLQAEVKPMITQCCMQALYETKNQDAISIAKEFERRRCNHFKDTKPAHECIKSIVDIDGENKHRYVVATDNERLRYSLRKIPGIPLVYMNRAVMVMETLSRASAKISEAKEQGKLTGGLNNVKSGTAAQEDQKKEDEQKSKKRKGPKEPNPLSIKKRKTKADDKPAENTESEADKKKRKRKHKNKSAFSEGNQEDDQNSNEEKSEVHPEAVPTQEKTESSPTEEAKKEPEQDSE